MVKIVVKKSALQARVERIREVKKAKVLRAYIAAQALNKARRGFYV